MPLLCKLGSSLLFCLAFFCLLSGCRQDKQADEAKQPAPGASAIELVLPETSCYPGAYVDFGEGEDDVTYDALTAFEKMTGKHHAIIAFGSFWGEQSFPAKAVNIVTAYGAVPMIYW